LRKGVLPTDLHDVVYVCVYVCGISSWRKMLHTVSKSELKGSEITSNRTQSKHEDIWWGLETDSNSLHE